MPRMMPPQQVTRVRLTFAIFSFAFAWAGEGFAAAVHDSLRWEAKVS